MTVDDFMKINIMPYASRVAWIKTKGKHKLAYIICYCGFDIETTTMPSHNAYMYHWQFSFNDYVICGRTWNDFERLIEYLLLELELSEDKRLLCFVANLGFEFQYIRKHFHITELFAKELRQPLKFLCDGGIEFHEALTITGGNLEFLAKNYCTTQKMVGDLDYSIVRNSHTPLTDKELQYCYNDVIILSEFSKYIFDNYIIPKKYVPMTKTGILRKEVKSRFPYKGHDMIMSAHPDRITYRRWMRFLFRGGYVHANILYVGYKIEDVASCDFTSSYPAQMNYSLYPKSPFIPREPTKDNVYKYVKTHCCIFQIVFKKIHATTPHAIESETKCINLVNPLIDNGRVRSADEMNVLITCRDFLIYKMFYDWEEMEVLSIQTSVRGTLPNYLIEPLNEAYQQKNVLKMNGQADTPEYAQKKSEVNSFYGLTVTRMVEREILYDTATHNWSYTEDNFNYDKEVKKAFLLPQWGIWVTANARYALLQQVYRCEMRARKLKLVKGAVIYCDTDSIKVQNYDLYKDIFDNYNRKIESCRIKQNLDKVHFDTLGKWDLEYVGYSGKYLGAKRYITTDKNGKTKVTVAGLPKKALPAYCDKTGKDIYEVFENNMLINVDISMKRASTYNDTEHEEDVDGELMRELSSVGIYPIEFTMKLKSFYLMLIKQMQLDNYIYSERWNE